MLLPDDMQIGDELGLKGHKEHYEIVFVDKNRHYYHTKVFKGRPWMISFNNIDEFNNGQWEVRKYKGFRIGDIVKHINFGIQAQVIVLFPDIILKGDKTCMMKYGTSDRKLTSDTLKLIHIGDDPDVLFWRVIGHKSVSLKETKRRNKSLNVERLINSLSKTSKWRYNQLSPADQLLYLSSHLGTAKPLTKRFRDAYRPLTIRSGRIIEQFIEKRRDLYDCRRFKTPKDDRQYFGIEIECIFPNEAFPCECAPDDCDCDEYDRLDRLTDCLNLELIRGVQVTEDGSIEEDSGSFGAEIKVLTSLDDLSNLKKVCEFIRKHDGSVNDSCGLHVHIDARHEEFQRLYDNLVNSLDFFFDIVPKSRRNNSFCQKGGNQDIDDKYYAINTLPYEDRSTIEVRLHSGTTNYTKIVNWLNILDMTRKSFIDWTNAPVLLNPELFKYVEERRAKFTKTDNDNSERQSA